MASTRPRRPTQPMGGFARPRNCARCSTPSSTSSVRDGPLGPTPLPAARPHRAGSPVDNLATFLPQDKVSEFGRMSGVQMLDRTIQVCEGDELLNTKEKLMNMNSADRQRQTVRGARLPAPPPCERALSADVRRPALGAAHNAGNQYVGAAGPNPGVGRGAPLRASQGAGRAREVGA